MNEKIKILVVDDQADITHFLTTSMCRMYPGYEVVGRIDGQQALQWLQFNTPNLLITDLRMPGHSGLELITETLNRYPHTPIVAMSAMAVPEEFNDLSSLSDRIQFIAKPFSLKSMFLKIDRILEQKPDSIIHGFTPISILQVVHMEDKTCRIDFTLDQTTATVHLEKGELTRAEVSNLKGEEALYEILSWKSPEIKLYNTPGRYKRNIEGSFEKLMLEFCRQKDETSKILLDRLHS